MKMLRNWLRKLRQRFKNYRFVVSWRLESGEIIYFKHSFGGGIWAARNFNDARKFKSYEEAREAADLGNSALIKSNPMRALEGSKVRARIHSASGFYIGEMRPQQTLWIGTGIPTMSQHLTARSPRRT